MRHTKSFFIVLAWLVYSCTGGQKMNQDEQGKTIILQNQLNLLRQDQPIVINRDQLVQMIGEIPADKQLLLRYQNNDLPSQLDDLDQDGSWDELSFLIDMPAESALPVQIQFVDASRIPEYPRRTNIRMAKKDDSGNYQELEKELRPPDHTKASPTVNYQMEGPAWENDIVAFRNYFDPRNGFDIFGKTTSAMVMDQVGINQDYHTLQDWGMDILKVNNSLGAGALAMYRDENLSRLGDTELAQFELISEGPVRSIFNLNYQGWQVNGNSYDLTQQITIWGGQHCYESLVKVSGLAGDEQLVTGMVNIQADSLIFLDQEDYIILASHDQQAYTGEYLGMALIIPQADFIQSAEAPRQGAGITETYLAHLNLQQGQSVRYAYYAAWELEDDKFRQSENFIDFLKQEALKQSNEIEIYASTE